MLFIISASTCVKPVTIGSDSDVGFFTITQLLADGDRIASFAHLEAGFILLGIDITGIFDSYFPVDGPVSLNGSILSLARNMKMMHFGTFNTAGTVVGNHNTLDLPVRSDVLTIPNSLNTFGLVDSYPQNAAVTSIDWSHDDQYIGVGMLLNGSEELSVMAFDGSSLMSQAGLNIPIGTFSVRWHPLLYYLGYATDDDISGDDVFIALFDPGASTVTQTSGEFLTGFGNAVAWRPDGLFLLSSSSNTGKEIIMISFDPGTGSTSILLTENITPNRIIQRNAATWNSNGSYFVVGTNDPGGIDTVLIYSFNSAVISFETSVYSGGTATAVDWSIDNFIAVGNSAGIERLRVFEFSDVGTPTLTEKIAARTGESNTVRSVHWNPDGSKLAVGLDAGAQTEFRIYAFDKNTQVLTLENELDFSSTVDTVRWSHDGQYIACDTESNNVSVYTFDIVPFVFEDITLRLNSDLAFAVPAIFKGACVIDGQGHMIDIADQHILVASDSHLQIRNARIKGVEGTNITCADATSKITYDELVLGLDASYSFTVGSLCVTGDCVVTGSFVFSYATDQVMTITSNSDLLFDAGVTFMYAPSIVDKTLITFIDKTASLSFKDSFLHATSVGMQLLKGTVYVENDVFVASDASQASEGITFGDGVIQDNSMAIEVGPESGLVITSGFVEQKNT